MSSRIKGLFTLVQWSKMPGRRFDLLVNLGCTKDQPRSNRKYSIRGDWTKDSLQSDNDHRITRRTTYSTIWNGRGKVFISSKDVISHGIRPMFHHEAEKNCNTQRGHISRRTGKSQNEMDKISARQALSSSRQWRSDDQEISFQKSIEPKTGYRWNYQMLWKTEYQTYQNRKSHQFFFQEEKGSFKC